ncbi:hypothetical protein G9A89_014007 [Geosiphon pyriformis]|nr:hypothetical protein G9A89_014007 [Geosiphon pyriformis]
MEYPKTKLMQRYRLCEAPASLLQLITTSNKEADEILENSTIMTPPLTPTTTTTSVFSLNSNEEGTKQENRVGPLRHNIGGRRRKNPYPIRSPDTNSEGITLNVDIYSAYIHNPISLRAPALSANSHKTFSSASLNWTSDSGESITSSRNADIYGNSCHNNTSHVQTRNRRQRQHTTQRTRRSKALGRVIGASNNGGDSNTVRNPPPLPQQEWRVLTEKLESLGLDNSVLEGEVPKVTWKGPLMQISNLPHYDYLHSTETVLASTLRLTPAQYLTSKSSIICAARRYEKRMMPFRKSDAQRLLRIDVNKSSKLWEFFRGIGWI